MAQGSCEPHPTNDNPPWPQQAYCGGISSIPLKLYAHLTVYRHPRKYRLNFQCPMLKGRDQCLHSLCTPCVITVAPDFVQGACEPHPYPCTNFTVNGVNMKKD